MRDAAADPRKQAILKAAFVQFATYGFRKTSMDDIAGAAGMSRPALYLHYRNKVDIYRSLVEQYYAETGAGLRAVLTGHDDPVGSLRAAFELQGAMVAEVLLSTPHGGELLESTNIAAQDLVESGEAELCAIYADWLEAGEKCGKLRLAAPPQEVARIISAALKGVKTTAADAAGYLSGLRHLAAMIGAGLAT